MIEKTKTSYLEFERYCSNYKISCLQEKLSEQYMFEIYKSVYRYRQLVKIIDYKNQYLNESVSDVMTAMFLSRSGMLKASMTILRGAIENFMRFLGTEYSSITEVIFSTNVKGLFEENVKYFNKYKDMVIKINECYSVYSDLCSFSHSALSEHQANYDSITEVSEIKRDKLKEGKRYFKRTNELFVYMLYALFYEIDKKHKTNISFVYRDFFVENIPIKFEKHLNNF